MAEHSWSAQTLRLIESACEEDLDGPGDISSAFLPDGGAEITAPLLARAAGCICGLALAPHVVSLFSGRLEAPIEFLPAAPPGAGRPLRDGDRIALGDIVGTLRGQKAALLAVERTLLNFLCRMSGVATLTQQYVRAAQGGARIFDTRKTLPGWRELDKYAVRCGGGCNHRMGLYDAVLLKDNHLASVPLSLWPKAIIETVNQARAAAASVAGEPAFVEVEVATLEQLEVVLAVDGLHVVMLDNFPLERLRPAVALRDQRGLRGRVELEASGGVTLETVAAIAAAGVDRISVGALTHSAGALDLALDFPVSRG